MGGRTGKAHESKQFLQSTGSPPGRQWQISLAVTSIPWRIDIIGAERRSALIVNVAEALLASHVVYICETRLQYSCIHSVTVVSATQAVRKYVSSSGRRDSEIGGKVQRFAAKFVSCDPSSRKFVLQIMFGKCPKSK